MPEPIKFIVFSDQHVGAKLYNVPELEKDNKQLLTNVIDLCIELNIKILVSTGDLFDSNKPSSEMIQFVSDEVARFKAAGGRPVAISGDHDKVVNGASWTSICGFEPASNVDCFVGVDYTDNPEEVIARLNYELNEKPTDTVEFIFLHQQIPELWPFCDEKKKLSLKDIDFSNQCASIRAIFLGDIHIRREVKYYEPSCDKNIFVGYCGSLGVTASNETKKDGLYLWANDSLNLIEYALPRQFHTFHINREFLDNLPAFIRTEVPKLKELVERPVFIGRYDKEVQDELYKLNFLYELGIPRFNRIKVDSESTTEQVNIRSELKTADRISEVLKVVCNKYDYSDIVYDTAHKLLNSDDPKAILDELKRTLYEEG